MKKNILKILILVVLVAVAGILLANANNKKNAEYDGWLEQSNEQYGFSIKYPSEYSISEPAVYFLQNPIFTIRKGNKGIENTNFIESFYTISVQPFNEECLKGDEELKINGIIYYKTVANGVAAGNIYDSEIYRTQKGNNCFESALTVHTGNISNYPEGSTQEIDKESIFSDLRKILETLEF